jgi:hypothetical protein
VGEALKLLVDADLDAEFLAQFADQTGFVSFPRLAFAAGEFPQAREVSAGGALGDEELPGAEDEAGADLHERRSVGVLAGWSVVFHYSTTPSLQFSALHLPTLL